MKHLPEALLFCILIGSIGRTASISPEAEALARAWAPLIWLHSEEVYYPSSVEFFLPEVTLNDEYDNITQYYVTPSNLPPFSSHLHMQTREELDCPSCTNLQFLYGQRIENGGVPVYTFIKEYRDIRNTIDVFYHAFYPYNRGKDVCIGSNENDTCGGISSSFGNHVGDWEHNRMRFVNGEPFAIYLSVHSFGAYYLWNQTANQFDFFSGEDLRHRAEESGPEERIKINYPPTVEVIYTEDGAIRPVAYSANGSHGLWATAGTFMYFPVIRLEDHTDQGVAWKTWENLVMIPWQELYCQDEFKWINFRGDWGNSAEGCQVEFISGECVLNSGPSGPPKGGNNYPVPTFFT